MAVLVYSERRLNIHISETEPYLPLLQLKSVAPRKVENYKSSPRNRRNDKHRETHLRDSTESKALPLGVHSGHMFLDGYFGSYGTE